MKFPNIQPIFPWRNPVTFQADYTTILTCSCCNKHMGLGSAFADENKTNTFICANCVSVYYLGNTETQNRLLERDFKELKLYRVQNK